MLNKVVIFVFFAHKKYSRCFVKLRLNHRCHIDYFTDICLWRVRKLSDFSKNILICVPKMNKGLTALERYEGE